MPRTNIPVTSVARDGDAAFPSGVAVDPTNQHVVTVGAEPAVLLVYVDNTHATLAKTVTFKTGPRKPANDLVKSVAALSKRLIRIGDTARYQQDDGTINIDLEAAITGTIAVFHAK